MVKPPSDYRRRFQLSLASWSHSVFTAGRAGTLVFVRTPFVFLEMVGNSLEVPFSEGPGVEGGFSWLQLRSPKRPPPIDFGQHQGFSLAL